MSNNDHVPRFTRADVERIVVREFGANSVTGIWKILDVYGKESWQKEVERVQMAALKCCDRDVNRLRRLIEDACGDYRDVLSAAEYPGAGGTNSATREETKREDIEQYWEWVRR